MHRFSRHKGLRRAVLLQAQQVSSTTLHVFVSGCKDTLEVEISMVKPAADAARSSGSNCRGGGTACRLSSVHAAKAASVCCATVMLARSIISSTIWFASLTCIVKPTMPLERVHEETSPPDNTVECNFTAYLLNINTKHVGGNMAANDVHGNVAFRLYQIIRRSLLQPKACRSWGAMFRSIATVPKYNA